MNFLKTLLRIAIILLLLAGIVVGGIFLVKLKRARLDRAPRFGLLPTPVHAATARKGDIEETRNYLAVVEPVRTATLAARVTAVVVQVFCDESDPVKKDQVLVELDSRQYRDNLASVAAQIEQAKADLAANRATVEALKASADFWEREATRDKTLAAKGAIPEAQAEATVEKAAEIKGKLEAAKQEGQGISHRIESLRRKHEELTTLLSYCTIRSPFNGVVSRRMVDPGDLASPGKALLVVEDRSKLKLAFDVPQEDLPLIKTGIPVRFRVEGRERTAALSHLFPSLDKARMLRAEVYLEGSAREGLTSGAYVPLRAVVRALNDVILLPASCIIESPAGKPFVFIITGGRLSARPVKVLATTGELAALEGVEAGEKAVRHTFLGWARLSAGIPVEVIE